MEANFNIYTTTLYSIAYVTIPMASCFKHKQHNATAVDVNGVILPAPTLLFDYYMLWHARHIIQ